MIIYPPNSVRTDLWLAYQPETKAWGMGLTEKEAIENCHAHPDYAFNSGESAKWPN
jgi:hypothetical protein